MAGKFKAGQYFMLPFAGKPYDLLIRAVSPSPLSWDQWQCEHVSSGEVSGGYTLLTSCRRVGPSEARRIIARATQPNPPNTTTNLPKGGE